MIFHKYRLFKNRFLRHSVAGILCLLSFLSPALAEVKPAPLFLTPNGFSDLSPSKMPSKELLDLEMAGRIISPGELNNLPDLSKNFVLSTLANEISQDPENVKFRMNDSCMEWYYRVFVSSSMQQHMLGLEYVSQSGVTRIWWDNELLMSDGRYDAKNKVVESDRIRSSFCPLNTGNKGWHILMVRQKARTGFDSQFGYNLNIILHPSFRELQLQREKEKYGFSQVFLSEGFRFYLMGIFVVSLFFYLMVERTRSFLWFCVFSFALLFASFLNFLSRKTSLGDLFVVGVLAVLLYSLAAFVFYTYLGKMPKRISWYFIVVGIITVVRIAAIYLLPVMYQFDLQQIFIIFMLGFLVLLIVEISIQIVKGIIKKQQGVTIIGFSILQLILFFLLCNVTINGHQFFSPEVGDVIKTLSAYVFPTSFLFSLIQMIRKNFDESLLRQQRVIDLTTANEKILEEQNLFLEQQVDLRTTELRNEKLIVEQKNTEILDSIVYARRIQSTILPSKNEIAAHFPNMFLLYRPKSIVAGDFYWMHRGKDSLKDWVLFAVCDCTGHGVPGALLSVVCSKALHRAVEECKVPDPGKILDKTTDFVIQELTASQTDDDTIYDGMDVSLCAWNAQTRTLAWAGSNNPLWIIRKEEGNVTLSEWTPDKQPIGITEERTPFLTHTLTLEPGDCIYLFSDGYADQFGGAKSKKFSKPAFRELLVSHSGKSMKEQEQELLQAHLQWKSQQEQVDDICVWGICL